MTLHPDWREIVKKAWSIRLIVLAGLLSGAEVAVPYCVDFVPVGVFSVLSGLVTAAAFVARLVAQK